MLTRTSSMCLDCLEAKGAVHKKRAEVHVYLRQTGHQRLSCLGRSEWTSVAYHTRTQKLINALVTPRGTRDNKPQSKARKVLGSEIQSSVTR